VSTIFVALAGHMIAIPRFGPMGAAVVTAAVACLGAFINLAAVRRFLKIELPAATLIRSLLLSGLIYAIFPLWPVQGYAVILKIVASTIAVLCGFLLAGELRPHEILFFRSAIRQTISRRAFFEDKS
jgi:O-antigen/teichoic acid export membrane protein